MRTDFCGALQETRTPDLLLRRQLLYPAELEALERVMGIEPTRPAWKAGILPLNYTRIFSFHNADYFNTTQIKCQVFFEIILQIFTIDSAKQESPPALRTF